MMNTPVDLPHIRNITVSGRIGCGATTLATHLAETLHWKMMDGGKLLRKINEELGLSLNDQNARPDSFDLQYEERVKKLLREEKHHIIQSHLAGFDAQAIKGVFKILLLCEDNEGNDKTEIRVDRVVNRDHVSVEEAKYEVKEREKQHLEKFRRLYQPNDKVWVYWDRKYYDLVINTYSHTQEETLAIALKTIRYKE